MGGTQVFRSTPGRVLTVMTAVAAVAGLVSTVVYAGPTALVRDGALLALVVLAVWALFWYPQVEVSDGEIVLRNVLRTIRVPWPTFRAADTRLALSVETTDGAYTAWAAPARSGLVARQQSARLRGRAATADRDPAAGSNTAEGVALEIAERHDALVAAGHLAPGRTHPDIHVTVRWHWATIGAAAALLGLTALGARVG